LPAQGGAAEPGHSVRRERRLTIDLADGCEKAPDVGCATKFSVKVENGTVLLDLDELNSLALDPLTSAA
jgi:hypothetical protein